MSIKNSVVSIIKKAPWFYKPAKSIYNKYQRLRPRRIKWHEMPFVAMIEVTNACNFSCAMCSNKEMTRPNGFMDLETFKLSLDRCEEAGILHLKLYTIGESFLNPKIMDMWRMAVSRPFKTIMVSTNGSLITEKQIKELLKTKKCLIHFSFGGWDKTSYEGIYKGGSFEDTVNKLRFINEEIKRTGLPKKTLRVIGLVSWDRDTEKCATFLTRSVGLHNSQLDIGHPHNFAGYFSGDRRIDSGISINTKDDQKPKYCRILDTRVGILYDGRVTACGCHDINAELVIGDIHNQSIRDIRSGTEYRSIIDKFKSGNLKGLICYKCDACYI